MPSGGTSRRCTWDDVAQRSFDDPKIKIGADPAKDTEPQMARRAFLTSDVSIGIDLFFGGGSYDFAQQAAAGRLVNSGLLQAHPDWFGRWTQPKFHKRSAESRSGTRTGCGSARFSPRSASATISTACVR